MEKKATPKKSTSKKTQVKATAKAAPKKTAQVVKTQKKTTQAKKTTQVVKTQKKAPKKVQTSQLKSKQNANTGYLLGITSLLAWIVPVVGAIVTVSGIYCCFSGMKSRKTLATIGLILNMLFLGIALVNVDVDLALMR